MRGSLFCLFLTLFVWGCGSREGKKVDLKDLVFKCTITNPVEDEVMCMNINGKEQVFEVPELTPEWTSTRSHLVCHSSGLSV